MFVWIWRACWCPKSGSAFSSQSGIPELRRTTRDEPDYEKLMRWRLAILKEHGLKLSDVQNVIAKIDPLPGAKEFLDSLREKTPGGDSERYV